MRVLTFGVLGQKILTFAWCLKFNKKSQFTNCAIWYRCNFGYFGRENSNTCSNFQIDIYFWHKNSSETLWNSVISIYILLFIEFTVQVTDLQIVWKKGGGDDLGSFVITAPIFEFLLEVPRVPKKESWWCLLSLKRQLKNKHQQSNNNRALLHFLLLLIYWIE